ncbi:serine/threonine-protein kinase [Nonomuraea sp. NPDC049141]|uniref:serine/threonine-protein kinase n=1 Tax=Nonomuraea sp. NPDC049141 TaxID=3155500 RepID=UPI00340E2FBE
MQRGEMIAGRYELAERLGRGGMGEVWAGRDRTLRRDVALKLLVLADAALPDLPERFEREAVAAAQINHPNVVALHDRGVHEDVLFLVMEKVEGAPLTRHIRDEAPMDAARALEIADGICTALIAAHHAGVIHYDIKPHNVMLTPDGQVKVVDFGIAGFVQTAFTLAGSSQLSPAGTPEYGAPEQFLTERGDARSDLYALGAVLFAMLTGRPPLTGHNSLAIMRRKLDEEAPRVDSLRPDLPPALTALVAELLDRDPEHRPKSALEVHERIGRLRMTQDVGASGPVVPPPPSGTKTTAPTRRLPEPHGAFEMSWTGEEPASAYAARLGKPGYYWFFWAVILLLGAALGIYFSLPHVHAPGPANSDNPWMIPFVSGILAALGALGCVIGAVVNTFRELRHAALSQRAPAWSLHIGPECIATTGNTGRREFSWDQMKTVNIEEIKSLSSWYRYAGVHIRFTHDAPHSKQMRPAGWFSPHPGSFIVRERVAVCVLGPMTEKQRTELVEALARFGSQRWKPPASFTSPPTDY